MGGRERRHIYTHTRTHARTHTHTHTAPRCRIVYTHTHTSHTPYTHLPIAAAGAVHLAEVVDRSASLAELRLSVNLIGNSGEEGLDRALVARNGGNTIGDSWAEVERETDGRSSWNFTETYTHNNTPIPEGKSFIPSPSLSLSLSVSVSVPRLKALE